MAPSSLAKNKKRSTGCSALPVYWSLKNTWKKCSDNPTFFRSNNWDGSQTKTMVASQTMRQPKQIHAIINMKNELYSINPANELFSDLWPRASTGQSVTWLTGNSSAYYWLVAKSCENPEYHYQILTKISWQFLSTYVFVIVRSAKLVTNF